MIVLGFDLESTGLDVDNDRIIEIGAVTYDTDHKVPLEVFSAFIRPRDPHPEGYVSPTGIRGEWLTKYGVSLPTALGEVQRMIATADPVAVIAHNGESFDKPLTLNELKRENIVGHSLAEMHWVDSRHELPFEKEPTSKRLKHLAADLGILNPFEHRAIFDVLTMLKILDHFPFESVLEQSKIPWITVRALATYDNRQKAKDLRYSWDGTRQIWLKKIKESALDLEVEMAAKVDLKLVKL